MKKMHTQNQFRIVHTAAIMYCRNKTVKGKGETKLYFCLKYILKFLFKCSSLDLCYLELGRVCSRSPG